MLVKLESSEYKNNVVCEEHEVVSVTWYNPEKIILHWCGGNTVLML